MCFKTNKTCSYKEFQNDDEILIFRKYLTCWCSSEDSMNATESAWTGLLTGLADLQWPSGAILSTKGTKPDQQFITLIHSHHNHW